MESSVRCDPARLQAGSVWELIPLLPTTIRSAPPDSACSMMTSAGSPSAAMELASIPSCFASNTASDKVASALPNSAWADTIRSSERDKRAMRAAVRRAIPAVSEPSVPTTILRKAISQSEPGAPRPDVVPVVVDAADLHRVPGSAGVDDSPVTDV